MWSSIKISNLARVLSVSCWCRHTVHHHRCIPGDRRSRQHLSRTLTHWEVHLVHFHFQMSAFLPNCQLLHSCRQQLSCVWSEDPPDGFCFPKQGVGNSKYHWNSKYKIQLLWADLVIDQAAAELLCDSPDQLSVVTHPGALDFIDMTRGNPFV